MLMGQTHSLIHCLVNHHNDMNEDAAAAADDDNQMGRGLIVATIMANKITIKTLRS